LAASTKQPVKDTMDQAHKVYSVSGLALVLLKDYALPLI